MNQTQILLPTRWDRPMLTHLVLANINDHNTEALKASEAYAELHILESKQDAEIDLTKKIRHALTGRPHLDPNHIIIIMEDDDYYQPNYIKDTQLRLQNHLVCGIPYTFYYHLGQKKHHMLDHPGRSSLFCTAFKAIALKGFKWPADTDTHLDIALWQHFNKSIPPHQINLTPTSSINLPLGIKHNIGKCGGVGHSQMNYDYEDDHQMSFLQKWTHATPNAFETYKHISKQLNTPNP